MLYYVKVLQDQFHSTLVHLHLRSLQPPLHSSHHTSCQTKASSLHITMMQFSSCDEHWGTHKHTHSSDLALQSLLMQRPDSLAEINAQFSHKSLPLHCLNSFISMQTDTVDFVLLWEDWSCRIKLGWILSREFVRDTSVHSPCFYI